jgi:hypothetical protein
MYVYINKSGLRFPHFLSFEVVLTSEVYYKLHIRINEISHLISDFRKKIPPWLGLEPMKMRQDLKKYMKIKA